METIEDQIRAECFDPESLKLLMTKENLQQEVKVELIKKATEVIKNENLQQEEKMELVKKATEVIRKENLQREEKMELVKKETEVIIKENLLRQELNLIVAKETEVMKMKNLQREEMLLNRKEGKMIALIGVPAEIQLSVALSSTNRLLETDAQPAQTSRRKFHKPVLKRRI